MPSPASRVAGIKIPIPPGAQDAAITDNTVRGLLDYLAFWIKFALDPQLATMTAPLVLDACPVANRFDDDPASLIDGYSLPALFVWWDGKSETKKWTTIKDVRSRNIKVMYIFERIADRAGLSRYTGLMSVVDGAFNRAISNRLHPDYAPPGHRKGAPIAVALELNELAYLGGTEVLLPELYTSSVRAQSVLTGPTQLGRGSANALLAGYPVLVAMFRVTEEVGSHTTLPTDRQGDLLVTSNIVGGDPSDPLPFEQRWLESPDAIAPHGKV